jgi:hypothetical protein
MNNLKTIFSGKGALIAAIALLSGPALAETAGRVTFVNGAVVVSAADGTSRVLQRGDSINGGEKISTRGGRVQIRFTDGGFVSLQPNSVFGVDEYLYTNRKPEETSLFFSLLQGGMRTITGTIGKVNKQSYKVRTPVATIGIRGTEYLASLDGDDLKVSVGAGLVNVANDLGNVTAGAGQNVSVNGPGKAPELSEEKAEALASGVNGDEPEVEEEEQAEPTVAVGNVLGAGGNPLLLVEDSFQSGPGYTVAYGFFNGADVLGGYNDLAADGGDSSMTVTFSDGGMQSATQYNEPGFDRGSAIEVVAHGGTSGSLKWGAWVSSGVDDGGSLVTVNAATEFLSDNNLFNYIVGYLAPPTAIASKNGLVGTYTFAGGTPVFATGASPTDGYIDDSSYIVVNFGVTAASVFPHLNIVINDAAPTTYNVTGSYSASASAPTFSGTASCSNSAGSCSAALSGFIAGSTASQVGLGYHINDTTRDIDGTAAFNLQSITDGSVLAVDGGQ